MTAKEMINWMKEKGYLHIWLLPLNGLQDSTPYSGRPVGNSPKLMPLDNSLNRDILKSIAFSFCFESFNNRWEGNHEGGKEIVLQFLNTKGNRPRTKA